MQGETEERPKRRKKKSKLGYYLYAVVILLLTVTNITLAILLLTHVQHVEVQGTKLATEEEIKAWLSEDPLTVNSLYTFFKFKLGKYEMPVYLEGVKVSLSLPWEVQVEVDEKDIIGAVNYGGSYVYIDEEGLVLKKNKELDAGVVFVEGIQIQGAKQFQKMKVKDEKIFSYIADIIYEVQKNEIAPNRIAWEDECMNLYFGEICVELGKMNYDVKIQELPPILATLEGKKGVLRMEHYSETSDSISFEEEIPSVDVPEDVEDSTEVVEDDSVEVDETTNSQ